MPINDEKQTTSIPSSPLNRQGAYQIDSLSRQILEKATKIHGLAVCITNNLLKAQSTNGLDTLLDLMASAEKILESAMASSKTLREAEGTALSGQAPTVDGQSSTSEWDLSESMLRSAPTFADSPSVASGPESLSSQVSIPAAQAATVAPAKLKSHNSLPSSEGLLQDPKKPIDNQVGLLHDGLALQPPRDNAAQGMHSHHSPKQPSPYLRSPQSKMLHYPQFLEELY